MELPSRWYGGSRWLQYFLRMLQEACKPAAQRNTMLFAALARWYCHQRRPAPKSVLLSFVYQQTPAPGEQREAGLPLPVWQQECDEDDTLGGRADGGEVGIVYNYM